MRFEFIKRLIREPLVHFALLACLVFLAYHVVHDGRKSEDMTIVVSSSEIERLAALYASEAGARPSDRDLQALIADHVRQQALAREARALGMADSDVVIERRLTQKMIFMISDTQQIERPSDDALQAWFHQNQHQFQEPERTTFDHIFFSDPSDPTIASTRQALAANPDLSWRSLGDPFILQRSYLDLTTSEITHVFGVDFVEQVTAFEAPSDRWYGPVSSALGTHLVRINARRASYLPAYSDIQSTVERAWREQAQRAATAQRVKTIIDKYEVEIEGMARP